MSTTPVLWMVSPAWRRFDVTRLAFAQRAHLVGVLAERNIHAEVLVVADDNNLGVAGEFGFHTLERDNRWLGRRFNDGIEYAAGQGADFITVVGSDDWLHPDLFDRLPLEIGVPPWPTDEQPVVFWTAGPEAVTGRELALVDLLSGRLRCCRGQGPYGVIPWVFPRSALEPCGFRPCADRLNRGLDGSMAAGLGIQPQWVFHDPHDLCRVDFKSDVNLNTYDHISGAIGYGEEQDAWARLAERYPAELVELAQHTHELLAGTVAA